MAGLRSQIEMTSDEVSAFLREERTVVCATNGRRGWPHLMPLWYVVREPDELWAWTYGRSQKVRNLERDARATLQVEAGDSYAELRGVMIEAQTEILHDPELVVELGLELLARDTAEPPDEEQVRRQAAKRVVLRFIAERVASFDHRKLP